MDVPVNGLTFNVTVAGPDSGAAPVLLLHGFPQNSAMWDRVTPYLHAAGLTTITMDQRGYSRGARPSGAEAYATRECVQDVPAVLSQLGVKEAHVVGHDWGSIVAWHLAGEHPERVRTLTAVSVPHPTAFGKAVATNSDQQQRSAYMRLFRQAGKAERVLLENDAARLRAIFAGCPPERVGAYVRPMLEAGALTAALNWYRAMDAYTTSCPLVSVPTSFIWGERDVAVGGWAARACAGYVTGPYSFAQVTGSHWLPDEMPEQVSAIILERAGKGLDQV